ncbi:MAG: hypothetical protein P4L33_15710 [Capsulimonadaceae bacterium]|nr:hypothetical protein [Capsulimonadaceae bacterium]
MPKEGNLVVTQTVIDTIKADLASAEKRIEAIVGDGESSPVVEAIIVKVAAAAEAQWPVADAESAVNGDITEFVGTIDVLKGNAIVTGLAVAALDKVADTAIERIYGALEDAEKKADDTEKVTVAAPAASRQQGIQAVVDPPAAGDGSGN